METAIHAWVFTALTEIPKNALMRKNLAAFYYLLRSMRVDTVNNIAEKMKIIGISGVDHHGLALIDPNMKPTYP